MHYVIGQLLSNPEMQLHQRAAAGPRAVLPPAVRKQLLNNPIAFNVGTLGPDFLFFNSDDWPAGLNKLGKMQDQMLDGIIDIRDKVGRAIPLVNRTVNLKKEAERAIEAGRDASASFDQMQHVMGNLDALMDLVVSTLTTGLKDLATSHLNVFSLLGSPITNCDPNDEWWWFDVLHYAKTGKFAERLLRNSKGNAQAHAYAVGYLSHVTADTVGHPYVNNVVRGPYRNHSQRHKVVENYQDVALYRDWFRKNGPRLTPEQRGRLQDEEFVNSELARLFRYNRDASHLPEREQLRRTDTIAAQLLPNAASVEMPDNIARLIAGAAGQTYGNSFGAPINQHQVKNAYRRWYSWFAKSTTEGLLPRSLPGLPPLDETIREWFNELVDQLERTAEAWKDVFSGKPKFSWKGVRNLFKKIGRAIAETARLAYELIDKINATIQAIPARVLDWGIKTLYQQFYKIYDLYRLSVSLNGFAFPATRHLTDPRVRHMIQPQQFSDAHNNALRKVHLAYPLQPVDFGGAFRSAPQIAHLVYPPVDVENSQLTEAPNTYRHHGPDYYADGPVHFDRHTVERLATTPTPLEKVEAEREALGNACQLTAAYYERFSEGQVLPDLNLDGDRGMAFPCWSVADCNTGARKDQVTPNFEGNKV